MPRWLKAVVWVVVIAVAVVVLFAEVFPRVERILEDPTMGQPGAAEHAAAPSPSPQAGPGQASRSPR